MALEVNGMRARVYALLNIYTASGELIAIAQDMKSRFGDSFGPDDIDNRLLSGARFFAARVRASYLPELIKVVNPTDPDVLHPSTANGEDPFYRLKGNTPTAHNNEADRISMTGLLNRQSTGKASTNAEPLYAYEGYEFVVADGVDIRSSDGNNPHANAKASVVMVPMFGGDASFDGVTWSGDNKTLPMPSRLERPIIYYALASCFFSKRMGEMYGSARERMIDGIEYMLLPFAKKELLSQE